MTFFQWQKNNRTPVNPKRAQSLQVQSQHLRAGLRLPRPRPLTPPPSSLRHQHHHHPHHHHHHHHPHHHHHHHPHHRMPIVVAVIIPIPTKTTISEDQRTLIPSICCLKKYYNESFHLLIIPPNESIIEFTKCKHWSHV